MKKVLGLILSFVLAVSVLSGLDLFAHSTAANANGMSDGGGPPQPPPPPTPPINTVTVQTQDSITPEGNAPDVNPPGDGSIDPKQPITEPPLTADCTSWDGSGRYPVEGAATCSGEIPRKGGGTYPFTCPVSSKGTSAIYVEYEETISYETTYSMLPLSVKKASDPVWPIQVDAWNTVYMGSLWTIFPRAGQWKLLGVQAWKTDIINPIIGPQITAGPTTYFASNTGLNAWKRINPFNHQGFQQGYFQSTTPTSTITKVECRYPWKPEPGPIYRVTCFVYYDSSFYQSQTKDGIRSGGSLLATRKGMKAGNVADINNPNNYGVTIANHLNCNNDTFQTTEVYDTKAPEDGGYGYYRLSAEVYAVSCQVWGWPLWTQNHDKDTITGCSTPFLYNTYNSYAVYSCNGFIATGQGANAWALLPDNENFSVSACEAFQCDISGGVQIGGTSAPLQVMRNGENLPVTYPTVTINTGGSATSRPANGAATWEEVTEAASGVLDGSSPFRGTNANDSKQYFGLRGSNGETKISFLTARSGDAVNSNNSNPSTAWEPRLINGALNSNYASGFVNFNWASAKNTNGVPKTWNMFRTFRVQGEFYVPIADGSSGNTTMGWQKETKYCGNVISNPVTVVRSVNEIK